MPSDYKHLAVCPICKDNSVCSPENNRKIKRLVCNSCGLVFVENLYSYNNPDVIYENAYQGKVKEAKMTDYRLRLLARNLQMDMGIKSKQLINKGVYFETLRWLEDNIAKGSTILDIGCGTGVLTERLIKEGYNAVGLDPAKSVVDMLACNGYTVWHGTVDTVPYDWQQPKAIICNLMMHHLPDPWDFLKTIRMKFPTAALLICQSIYVNANRSLAPPRELTAWSTKSLTMALEKAGYNSKVVVPRLTPQDEPPRSYSILIASVQKITIFKALVPFYYAVKPALLWPWAVWCRMRKAKPINMLGIGIPR